MPELETPPATPPAAPPAPAPAPKDDAAQRFQKLLDKHNGDAQKLALVLHADNFKHREQIRELQGKVPAEGAVVLTADQAKLWEQYTKLGSPEDLNSARYERDEFQRQIARSNLVTLHQQAAEAHGFKASVLTSLLDQHDLEIELKEVTTGGKTAKVASVKVVDEKDPEKTKFVPLPEYAKSHWGDFLPALAPDGDKTTRRNGTPTTRPAHMPPPPSEPPARRAISLVK